MMQNGSAAEGTGPVIILGAARSGTKMLRGLIAAHSSFSAIPWDINFVWKYDNYGVPHDELRASDLTPTIRGYIRNFFERRRNGRQRIVEKTVSNTLRVGFVRAVFPECRLVHIVRDGREVTESAHRMWQEPMDPRRVVEKLASFPVAGIPSYAFEYAWSNLRRVLHPDRRVATWGPRFLGIAEATRSHTLLEVCGLQWQRCVEEAQKQLALVPVEQVLELRYERLVLEPQTEIGRLCAFLGIEFTQEMRRHAEQDISPHNLAKWQTALSATDIDKLLRIIGPTLEELGYR